MQQRPQLRLAVVCQVQELFNDTLHLCCFTPLEQCENARCAEGDAVQRLREGVVQVARHSAALLLHRHIGRHPGPLKQAAAVANWHAALRV